MSKTDVSRNIHFVVLLKIFKLEVTKESIMSNMEEIIQALQGYKPENKKRWIDSTTGWQNLTEIPDDYSKKVIDGIKDFFDVPENNEENKSRTKITLVKKNEKVWFYREEEALERLICLFNDDCSSQYSLGQKAKESVDIVISRGGKRAFIELKPWDSGNSPMFGVVELLKNYFLCSDNKNITELIFLAPKEYFEKYTVKGSWVNFFEFVDNANEQLNGRTTLKVKYIDLSKQEFETSVQSIHINESEWIKKETSQYTERLTIDLSEQKDCFKSIQDKLIFKDFTAESFNEF